MTYASLDGYEVRRTTGRAIGIAKARSHAGTALEWVPRSLCEDGDSLSVGDRDISVAEFKAEDLGLDT